MENECLSCSKTTSNPKFCSRSCAATHNNRIPKRKRKNKCKTCEVLIRSCCTYCGPCYKKQISSVDMTLAEAKYTTHGKQSTHALVRTRARAVADPKGKCCVSCGYIKHVEVCHIQAVSTFPETTLLSVINSPSNLVILCPNCHWEFDHGLLKLEGLTGLEPA